MKNAIHWVLACSAAIPILPAYAQEVAEPAAEVQALPDTAVAADTAAPAEAVEAAPVEDTAAAPLDAPVAEAAPAAEEAAERQASGGSRLIEEVIVSAQRRDEKLQEVPISVTAFSAEKLDALGVKTTEELPSITPGLVLSNKAGYTIIYLRGVGTDAFLPAADPNVPIYIDGVPQLTNQGISNVLGRIERVEVLKGPQGTLFGRNSTGGAVTITTPDPTPEFGGEVGTEIGNYGTFNNFFFLNVPMAEGLGATISGYDNRQDTFYECTSCQVLDTFARGVRGKVVWDATDALSFSATAVYGETSNPLALLTKLQRPAPVLSAGGLILPEDKTPGARRVTQDMPGGVVSVNRLVSGGATWLLPGITAKFMVSDQHIGNPFAQWDFDSTNRPLVSFRVDDQYADQNTFELQFQSTDETPFHEYFSFTTGVFYLKGDGGFPNLILQVGGEAGLSTAAAAILLGNSNGLRGAIDNVNGVLTGLGLNPVSLLTGPVTLQSGGIIQTDSLSGYFQGTINMQSIFDLSVPTNLTLGARYSREERGLIGARLGVVPPLLVPAGSADPNDAITAFNFEVPKVKDYQMPLRVSLNTFPTDDVQLYAAWARGFTAPTYNPVNFFTPPDALIPQQTDSYEIGAKTQLFDRTLTFNTAAFYIKQKDVLTGFLSITSGGIVRFDNVPGARIYGLEMDTLWQAMPELNPGLVLTASATYLDGKYTDYPNGRGFDVETGLSFGEGAFLPARDLAGNKIVNTPELTFNVGINQAIAINDANAVELGADVSHNSGFYNVPQNEPEYHTDAYTIVNARAVYFYRPWGIETTAFVKNLLDKDYNAALFVSDFGAQNTLAPPRMYGVRLKWVF